MDPGGIVTFLPSRYSYRAVAVSAVGFYDGTAFHSFAGEVAGRIVAWPRGEHGFGWDPIFEPGGSDKTFAEIPPDAKLERSMRRKAILAFRDYLNKQQDE